jgi:hypothetical protein
MAWKWDRGAVAVIDSGLAFSHSKDLLLFSMALEDKAVNHLPRAR